MKSKKPCPVLRPTQCHPFRLVKSPDADSWIFPDPGDAEPGSARDFCAFRIPGTSEFAHITSAVTGTDVFNNSYTFHSKESRFLRLSWHHRLPVPTEPAQYSFQFSSVLDDPDPSADDWDGYGQWVGHKIGGTPFSYFSSPQVAEVKRLAKLGFVNLIQLGVPGGHIDLKYSDDYHAGGDDAEWLFGDFRVFIMVNFNTGDYVYFWGD